MRWFSVIAAALALLLAATVFAHGTEVSVVGDVRPNGPIEIRGEEFEPDDQVRLELKKEGVEPIELGRVSAEADGSFTITLHLPATVSPGIYELAADGKESATTEVTVLEPAAGGTEPATEHQETESVSSDRPAGETVGLGLATAVLAALGAGLLWLSRTRAHSGRA